MDRTEEHEKTLERVIEIVTRELSLRPGEVKATSNVYQDLGADSLDAVSIAMRIETEFNIEIPDNQFKSFMTPATIVDGIMSSKIS